VIVPDFNQNKRPKYVVENKWTHNENV
jgi:hypothetical protein